MLFEHITRFMDIVAFVFVGARQSEDYAITHAFLRVDLPAIERFWLWLLKRLGCLHNSVIPIVILMPLQVPKIGIAQ